MVIDDFSMRIPSGKVTGLLGVNGAGKTTLIKILTSLLKPTEGVVLWNGKDIESCLSEYRSVVNIVNGGTTNLYQRLTGRQNLRFFGSLYKIPKLILNERITSLLNLVGLDQHADKKVETYSTGMVQRLQLAKGLINQPSFIFLDEPTLGMDLITKAKFKNIVQTLTRENNTGIVLTTHLIEEAETLCSNIYLISQGKNYLSGSPDKLKRELNSERIFKIYFDSSAHNISILSKSPVIKITENTYCVTVSNETDDVVRVLNKLHELNISSYNIVSEKPSLKSAMLKFEEQENAKNRNSE